MGLDEFSCPSCRSNLYDPISGCLTCSNKGTKALRAKSGGSVPSKPTKSQRQKQKQHAVNRTKQVFVKYGLKAFLKSGQSMIACPFCGDQVKLAKVVKHLEKVHQQVVSAEDIAALVKHAKSSKHLIAPSGQTKIQAKKDLREGVKQPSSKTVYYPADQYEHMKESFRQSLYDQRDASSSYAHHFRENGRFGSHPLHDDYDDESFPD